MLNIVSKLISGHNLMDEPLRGRIIVKVMKKASKVKTSSQRTREGDFLAREYAKYKLALLSGIEDDKLLKVAVIQNFISSRLVVDGNG